jgi:hypothetical protein
MMNLNFPDYAQIDLDEWYCGDPRIPTKGYTAHWHGTRHFALLSKTENRGYCFNLGELKNGDKFEFNGLPLRVIEANVQGFFADDYMMVARADDKTAILLNELRRAKALCRLINTRIIQTLAIWNLAHRTQSEVISWHQVYAVRKVKRLYSLLKAKLY